MAGYRFYTTTPGVEPPRKAHANDAGYDLKFLGEEHYRYELLPGERKVLETGTYISLSPGHVAMVCSRSGLAAKHGVIVLNAPGIVDAGYDGELKVILHNTSTESFHFEHGDRIAQLVILEVAAAARMSQFSVAGKQRSANGFGSTGVQS